MDIVSPQNKAEGVQNGGENGDENMDEGIEEIAFVFYISEPI